MMYLGRRDLLALFGQGHCLGSENVWQGRGRVLPLPAETSWTGLLLWFPAREAVGWALQVARLLRPGLLSQDWQ